MAGYAIKELQDDFLTAIRASQEMTIQAVRAGVAVVQPVIPEAFYAQLPLGELPKPQEISAGFFDFAQKLLDTQRHFAQEWLGAADPLVRGRGGEQ